MQSHCVVCLSCRGPLHLIEFHTIDNKRKGNWSYGVFILSGAGTETDTGAKTRRMGNNRYRPLSWFRCNVKTSTQFHTTHLLQVPVPVTVMVRLHWQRPRPIPRPRPRPMTLGSIELHEVVHTATETGFGLGSVSVNAPSVWIHLWSAHLLQIYRAARDPSVPPRRPWWRTPVLRPYRLYDTCSDTSYWSDGNSSKTDSSWTQPKRQVKSKILKQLFSVFSAQSWVKQITIWRIEYTSTRHMAVVFPLLILCVKINVFQSMQWNWKFYTRFAFLQLPCKKELEFTKILFSRDHSNGRSPSFHDEKIKCHVAILRHNLFRQK